MSKLIAIYATRYEFDNFIRLNPEFKNAIHLPFVHFAEDFPVRIIQGIKVNSIIYLTEASPRQKELFESRLI
jgi:hypothetical protein